MTASEQPVPPADAGRRPVTRSPAQIHAALLEDALFQVKRVVVGQDRLVERVHGLPARPRPLPHRGRARPRQDAHRVDAGQRHRRHVRPRPVHARPRARRPRRHPHLAPVDARTSTSSGARSSRTSCSPTRSTARPRRCSRRCSRPWPSARSSIGGHTRRCPSPFLVLATQNPIESEGVYALPEAQRDRFLMQVVVPQPTYEEETEIALRMSTAAAAGRAGAHARAAARAAGRRPRRVRAPRGAGLRRAPRHGDARPARWGLAGPRPAHRARREPARHARPDRRGPGARRAARPSVRRAAGRLRRRARGAAAPHHADLRRARRGRHARRRAARAARPRAGAAHRAPAGQAAPPRYRRLSRRRMPRPPDDRTPQRVGGGLRRGGRRRAQRAAPPRARGPAPARRQRQRRPRRRSRSGRAASAPAPAPTSRATTRASSTGTSRPGRSSVWCARPRPTASSRPGSSPTARPASTSARPAARSATSSLGATAAFGMLTVRGGNRLGCSSPAPTGCSTFPPDAGALRSWRARRRVRHPARAGAAPHGATVTWRRCAGCPCTQPRRSQVVVISDFLGGDAWARALRRLASATTVVAVHVTDPRELELPAVGMLAVVDAETGRQRYVPAARRTCARATRRPRRQRHARSCARIAGSGRRVPAPVHAGDWLTDTVRFAAGRRPPARGAPATAPHPPVRHASHPAVDLR